MTDNTSLVLDILMADPAGNRTAFVLNPTDPSLYAAVGAAIMDQLEDLGAEQVGFAEPPREGGLGRLVMSGGEFCGNGARSFGYMLVKQFGLPAGSEVLIEMSGAEGLLPVHIEAEGASAGMPLPGEFKTYPPFLFEGKETKPFAVPVGGILLAVVPESVFPFEFQAASSSQAFADAMIDHLRDVSDAPAAGCIFLSGWHITPYVWVRDTGTRVWESSCGSGAVAAACFLCREEASGTFSYEFEQPGGILGAIIQKEGGRVIKASLSGPVILEEAVTRMVTIPAI